MTQTTKTMNFLKKYWGIILILSVILAIALIAGCDSAAGFGGGERIVPTRDTKDFTVRLNIVKERDIQATCERLGVPYEAEGCNAFHSPANFCDIYVMMPESMDDDKKMEIIGHELLHCRFGEYHK